MADAIRLIGILEVGTGDRNRSIDRHILGPHPREWNLSTNGMRRIAMPSRRADFVRLFTDGACSGNPGPGGWAFILHHPASGQIGRVLGRRARNDQ